MIKIVEFEKTLATQLTKYWEYDEHILRLHLMAYTVFEQIYRKEIGWFLLKHIERNYYGLLRFELVKQLIDDDPFCLRNLNDDLLPDLNELIWFQVKEFRARPRERSYSSHLEDYEHLLNELAVLDRDAVRDIDDDAAWREENKDNLQGHLSKYFHSLFVEINGKKLIIEPQKLSLESYLKFADYNICEFYYFDYLLNPDDILTHIFSDDSFKDASSIYCMHAGVGNGLLHLVKKFPDMSLIGSEVRTRSLCENFLCEVNLWPVCQQLSEPLVTVYGDPFDDYQQETDENLELYDRVVGVVSEHESLGLSKLNRKAFKLSFGSDNVENRYLEFLVSKVEEWGRVFVAVPERFLFSRDSRKIREFYLSDGSLKKVCGLTKYYSAESMGLMAVLEFSNELNQTEPILFAAADSIAALSPENIRIDNPDLDLRPSKFLDTVEFRHREVLEVFEKGYLAPSLRNDVLKILNALEGKSEFKYLFIPARVTLEAICFRLNELSPKLIPIEVFGKKTLILKNTLDYLSGKKVKIDYKTYALPIGSVFPKHISSCVNICKELGDSNAHFYTTDVGINAFKSSGFALIELLDWFKDFCEQSTPN